MNRRNIYIGISILIAVLIVGLLAWSIFVGKQQRELQNDTTDLGYFGSPGGTPGGRGGLFGSVFGSSSNTQEKPGSTKTTLEPQLRQLYNLPTAGYARKRSGMIRFVDRATGHVFERELPDGATTRVNQTTVPQVYEALLVEDGNGIIRRYLDTTGRIVSVYNNIEDEDAPTRNLPFARDMIVSPSGNEIAYVEETNQGSDIVISKANGDSPRTVTRSALRGWTLQWRANTLLLTQKASGDIPGSAFTVNIDSGVTTVALQQKAGLTTNLDPNGTTILYSTAANNREPTLFVHDITTNETRALNVLGLADKCIWQPTGAFVYCALPNTFPRVQYPDAWYKGEVHFSDSLWEVSTDFTLVTQLFSPQQKNGVSLDIYNLTTDATADTIFFKNNTDQTLWSLTFPRAAENNANTIDTATDE